LGDKIETVEHYALFVPALRERDGAYWKTAKGWKELARKRQAPQQKRRNFNRISGRACKPDSVI